MLKIIIMIAYHASNQQNEKTNLDHFIKTNNAYYYCSYYHFIKAIVHIFLSRSMLGGHNKKFVNHELEVSIS